MRRAPRFSRSACSKLAPRYHAAVLAQVIKGRHIEILSQVNLKLDSWPILFILAYAISDLLAWKRLDRSAFGKIEESTKGSVETWILSAVVGPFFIQDSMGKPAAPSDMPKPLRVTPAPQQKGDSLALPMSSGDQLGHPVHGIFKGQSVRNLEHSLRLGVAAAFAGSISVCR